MPVSRLGVLVNTGIPSSGFRRVKREEGVPVPGQSGPLSRPCFKAKTSTNKPKGTLINSVSPSNWGLPIVWVVGSEPVRRARQDPPTPNTDLVWVSGNFLSGSAHSPA